MSEIPDQNLIEQLNLAKDLPTALKAYREARKGDTRTPLHELQGKLGDKLIDLGLTNEGNQWLVISAQTENVFRQREAVKAFEDASAEMVTNLRRVVDNFGEAGQALGSSLQTSADSFQESSFRVARAASQ